MCGSKQSFQIVCDCVFVAHLLGYTHLSKSTSDALLMLDLEFLPAYDRYSDTKLHMRATDEPILKSWKRSPKSEWVVYYTWKEYTEFDVSRPGKYSVAVNRARLAPIIHLSQTPYSYPSWHQELMPEI